MPAKRKRCHVTVRHQRITIYPWTHPASGAGKWRFGYKDSDGKTRYITRGTKQEAEDAAEAILKQKPEGIVWETISPARLRFLSEVHRLTSEADEEALLAFLKSRHESAEIAASVERYIAFKLEESGEETPHFKRVTKLLRQMSGHFAGRQVIEILGSDLESWWVARGKGLGDKRRGDIRQALVQFWGWAQKRSLTGTAPVTVAQALPSPKVKHGSRATADRGQMLAIFKATLPENRVNCVLGAFAGMRPEEVSPGREAKVGKRGLRCEEIDWVFKVIRIAPEVSKVGLPRVIPMSDALVAFLEWAGIRAGMTGPVSLFNAADEKETQRLGGIVFGGSWPGDVLRHTYGSYRNAIIRNLPQLAEEMGTSVAMLNRHYHNPKAREEGETFFAMRPDMIRFDPISQGNRGYQVKSGESQVTDVRRKSAH